MRDNDQFERQMKSINREDPIYKAMDPIQRFGVKVAEEIFLPAVELGFVGLETAKGKVLDFGCGTGGPTYFLSYNDADVTAVDMDQASIDRLVQTGILPRDKVMVGDGIKFMSEQPDNSYDLVTAFMLDPSIGHTNATLLRAFWKEARRIIKPQGIVYAQSDVETRSTIRTVLSGQGIVINPGMYEEGFLGFKIDSPQGTQFAYELGDDPFKYASNFFPSKNNACLYLNLSPSVLFEISKDTKK